MVYSSFTVDFGIEVEMKCGDVVVTVKLIEVKKSEVTNIEAFWATVQQDEKQEAVTMKSEWHRRHSYPTWEGSDTQTMSEGKDKDDDDPGGQ